MFEKGDSYEESIEAYLTDYQFCYVSEYVRLLYMRQVVKVMVLPERVLRERKI